jgi:hypothetical protein
MSVALSTSGCAKILTVALLQLMILSSATLAEPPDLNLQSRVAVPPLIVAPDFRVGDANRPAQRHVVRAHRGMRAKQRPQ